MYWLAAAATPPLQDFCVALDMSDCTRAISYQCYLRRGHCAVELGESEPTASAAALRCCTVAAATAAAAADQRQPGRRLDAPLGNNTCNIGGCEANAVALAIKPPRPPTPTPTPTHCRRAGRG